MNLGEKMAIPPNGHEPAVRRFHQIERALASLCIYLNK